MSTVIGNINVLICIHNNNNNLLFLADPLLCPVSKAKIMTNSEMYIKSGNDINLTCVTMQAPTPPLFIYWYKNGNIINYAQRGGINIITERQSKTSKLIIDRATTKDSGNYTCSPSDSGELSFVLYLSVVGGVWPNHVCIT